MSLFALMGTSCRMVQTATNMPGKAVRTITPGKKDALAADPVEVQQTLLRFADEFAMRMTMGVEKMQHSPGPMTAAEALRWKIALGTEINAIVSGPNAMANLLDMTVFVTATRAALEAHWRPRVFGDSALPLLEASRQAETNIWHLAARVLKPAQQSELREAIEQWHQDNPVPESVIAARAVGFAAKVAPTKTADAAKPDSVFNLLGLDPLSGLDPATREIAQTRLLAERALHVAQRMPMLLRWQAELLAVNTADLPVVQQLTTNSTELTASVDRFARVAEQLPRQISTEREEILKALQSQEKGLATLAAEFRQTLVAGSQMSTSLNTTLTTFDGLMQRFGVGETNATSPPATNAEPFRIQDYTRAAAQLEASARQLTELLRAVDSTAGSTNLARLTAQVTPVVQQAQAGGKELVDHAFRRAVLFVAIASGIVLGAALLYRVVGRRLAPAASRHLTN